MLKFEHGKDDAYTQTLPTHTHTQNISHVMSPLWVGHSLLYVVFISGPKIFLNVVGLGAGEKTPDG